MSADAQDNCGLSPQTQAAWKELVKLVALQMKDNNVGVVRVELTEDDKVRFSMSPRPERKGGAE